MRCQQSWRTSTAIVRQRAGIVMEVDAAAECVDRLTGIDVLAGQDRAKQVRALARAAGKAYLAPNQEQPIPVQAAVDLQVAIHDQDA